MSTILTTFEEVFGKGRIRFDEPIGQRTSFRCGGNAQYFLDVDTTADLIAAVGVAKKLQMPFSILGSGTHSVVSQKGIPGLVIKNNCRKFDVMRLSGRIKNQQLDVDRVYVFAESGVITNQLVRFTLDQGYGGLEYHLGLPGTIGGALYTNAYYQQTNAFIGDNLYMAKIVTKDGVVKDVGRDYFLFDKEKTGMQKSGDLVLSTIFALYPQDKKLLWEKGMSTMQNRIKKLPSGQTGGYTFRNVFLSQALKTADPYKNLSFDTLLQRAGLTGYRVGDAMFYEKNANVILNTGNATAEDFFRLLKTIREQLLGKFGIIVQIHGKIIGQ